MYHAHSLIQMKNYKTWWRACKYTSIPNHAGGKQAADSITQNHHLLLQLYRINHRRTVSSKLTLQLKILTAVKQVLQNKDLPVDVTLDKVLATAHVTLDDYTKALTISKSGESIILKRQPSERNVNCYSPAVLRTWQANMDI